MNVRNGRPASGITGFGSVSVSGRRRVPSPPASTSACTGGPGLPADALVREALLLQEGTVEEVAPVDYERLAHLGLRGRPGQLAEPPPLGPEPRGVGAVERLLRRGADLRARQ